MVEKTEKVFLNHEHKQISKSSWRSCIKYLYVSPQTLRREHGYLWTDKGKVPNSKYEHFRRRVSVNFDGKLRPYVTVQRLLMQKRFEQGTARIWEDCISGNCFWIQSRPNIWTYSPTDFLTRSPTHHATRRRSQHPDHLAHPRLSVFHRCATTTTTRQARTTTPVTPRATAVRTVKKTTTPMTPLTNSFFFSSMSIPIIIVILNNCYSSASHDLNRN